ncbi:hypothetical protein CALCODRAFT_496110 [Calocera cornea HHB12733]|uniref:F-box domain-containing protein n=1 Tax=Calocera cornea HHB12733 TaxID=1353952 RepID=A0A165G109_9BASI|nr:hypothetical protein CALCODRAFT_496110 [Calocera cornea HHB12733]
MYLPPELLDHIVRSVRLLPEDKPTLLSLCLCSTTLYELTTRYLFRSPRLRTFSQTFYFSRLLTRKPHLAAHVRALNLTLHHPTEVHRRLARPAFLRLVFRALRAMKNLRNLEFHHMDAGGYRCVCGTNIAAAQLPLLGLTLPIAMDARALLSSLPSLVEVELPDHEPTYALDILSAAAVPNMQIVRLIRNAIVYFVPGRPVTQLSIVGIITPDEVPIFIAPLGRSTGPLQRLSIHVFKVDTGFYEEVAACVPFLVDLVAYSEVEDHVKMLSHLKRNQCIQAFQEFKHLQTLELHASSIGRVVTSVQALPLLPLMQAAHCFYCLILINEKDPDIQEVERYCFVNEEDGGQYITLGYWARQVEVTRRGEFLARRARI